ncbi:MAG: class I SAM-dependent methyltransferase [Methanophagales archaeon]|nr:class I SAM-dependent methyltransferase [Methanophagales archaeon]
MTENFTKSGFKNYDKAYLVRSESLRNPGDSAKDDLIANFITSNTSTEKEINILDIGCGMGQTMSKLISKLSDRRKVKLAGIDSSKIGLLKARNKIKNVDFVCAAVEAIPFRDSAFDVIILKDLLEHIPEDYLVLSEASRLIKSDGLLIIYVPHKLHGSFSFESIIQYLFNYNIDEEVGHVRRYDLNEISTLLSEYNFKFKIKFYNYFGHFVFGIISIIGVKMEKLLQSETNTGNNSKFIEIINRILQVIVWSGKFEYMWLKKHRGPGLFIVARSIKNKVELIEDESAKS